MNRRGIWVGWIGIEDVFQNNAAVPAATRCAKLESNPVGGATGVL